MLTVVDQLTKLASRHFVLGAFVPVLVFSFLNGAIAYSEFDWFRDRTAPQISALDWTFDAIVMFVGMAVAAYVLWSLNSFMRKVLEGRYLTRDWPLGQAWRGEQDTRRDRLREDRRTALRESREIAKAKQPWTDRLINAAAAGRKAHARRNAYDGKHGPAAEALEALRSSRARGAFLPTASIERVVAALEGELRKNDIGALNATADRKTLSEDRLELLVLFDSAHEAWTAREVACANALQTRFGTGAVAPTALGNIAESMRGYALSRYSLDLDTFWSRLQPILQKYGAFFATLQDAKAQLDFLVASVFLSTLTTAVWVVALPLCTDAVGLFLIVAVLGPLTTIALYRTAMENYLAFGELVRTAVDLHRFELLDALRVSRPNGLRDERALWQALQRISSYGVEWVDLSYEREPPA